MKTTTDIFSGNQKIRQGRRFAARTQAAKAPLSSVDHLIQKALRAPRVPAARVSFVELDGFIAPLQKAAALLSETILQTAHDFEESEATRELS